MPRGALTHALGSLTDGFRGTAGFARPHRVDRAFDGGLEERRGGACEVGEGEGGGGILLVVTFEALARALRYLGAEFLHLGYIQKVGKECPLCSTACHVRILAISVRRQVAVDKK